ncbi:MAG: NUDIX hydrolase, partial [Ktedonobacterales bacterium]
VPVTPRPAAAVVVARERPGGVEVFMVRRHIRSEFVPDAFVFPGGSVKPSDSASERVPPCAPVPAGRVALGTGLRVAALRECFEEAGVLVARRGDAPLAIPPEDVARFGAYRNALDHDEMTLEDVADKERLTLATDELLHWAHWITPEAFPKRFDTHFFLAAMPERQEAAHDQLETTAGVWITPEEALAGFERGEFPIVFATILQLRELTGLESIAAARARFAGVTPRTIMPRVVERDGASVIVLPDED